MLKCKKGYEIIPIRSNAGWYVGTVDKDKCPNCRISSQYAETAFKALELPLDRQTHCIENEFCNGGKGCFN